MWILVCFYTSINIQMVNILLLFDKIKVQCALYVQVSFINKEILQYNDLNFALFFNKIVIL